MCQRCEAIDITIARYRRLKDQVDDFQMREAADKLIARLEADKLTLHPKE